MLYNIYKKRITRGAVTNSKNHYKLLHSYEENDQYLMMDEISGELCLKKYLEHHEDAVYEYIKEHRSAHIPAVIDYGTDDRGFYVIEEFIKGKTLDRYLAQNSVDTQERRKILDEIMEGLIFLHSAEPPIVHRDLKAENILIDRYGGVHLIDYDAAKTIKPGEDRDTELIGTIGNAAPEQYGFSQSDQRTDIYALGLMIREMFPGITKYQRVADKATKIDPEQRYASVGALRRDLDPAHGFAAFIKRWAFPISVAAAALVLVISLWFLRVNDKQDNTDLTVDTGESVTDVTEGETSELTEPSENDENNVIDTTRDTTRVVRETSDKATETTEDTENSTSSRVQRDEPNETEGTAAPETATPESAAPGATDAPGVTTGSEATPSATEPSATGSEAVATPTVSAAGTSATPTPASTATATPTPSPTVAASEPSQSSSASGGTGHPAGNTATPTPKPTNTPTPYDTPYEEAPTDQNVIVSPQFFSDSVGALTIKSEATNPIYSVTVTFPEGYTLNIDQRDVDFRYTLSQDSSNSFTLTYSNIADPTDFLGVYHYSWTPETRPDTITLSVFGEQTQIGDEIVVEIQTND